MTSTHALYTLVYLCIGLAVFLVCLLAERRAGGRIHSPEVGVFALAFALGWPLLLVLFGVEYLHSVREGGMR